MSSPPRPSRGGLPTDSPAHSFQTIHALTLTANGQKFIEDPSASSATSYDQAVSFNRSTFTATTTRDLSDSDAVQEVLELELASVERVLVTKVQGEWTATRASPRRADPRRAADVLEVRIVSFHPPTLESAAMPMDKGAENGEHYIAFTVRLEDGARLSEVLDARELVRSSQIIFVAQDSC